MSGPARLHDLVGQGAERHPCAPAVIGPEGTTSYGELESLACRIARGLAELGVRRGDRVGIWLEKSARVLAAMQGILKLEAAYVPVDPLSPAPRAKAILDDCQIAALVSDRRRAELLGQSGTARVPTLLTDSAPCEGQHQGMSWADLQAFSDEHIDHARKSGNALAYILYTSGSTGLPKGVCISHRNALSFVDWAVPQLAATPSDVFSNHAPFHFDLSVLDIYGAFRAGASLAIVPEGISYSARQLAEFPRKHGVTIWYSVPSALILMMNSGGFMERAAPSLRVVIFAGEVYPIKELRSLRAAFPRVRLLNFYGPTETNVCTFHEVQELAEDRTRPVPIGLSCSGNRVWAADRDGRIVEPGQEGELHVEGPTVMLGYWGGEPQGNRPYATGDRVIQCPDGGYDFVGRRDHQVKVRGHRIELGEVEAALLQHPEILEAVALVVGDGPAARLVAMVVCASASAPSLLALKRHCAACLPRYMIIDRVRALTELPRTGNGKIDRIRLRQMAGKG